MRSARVGEPGCAAASDPELDHSPTAVHFAARRARRAVAGTARGRRTGPRRPLIAPPTAEDLVRPVPDGVLLLDPVAQTRAAPRPAAPRPRARAAASVVRVAVGENGAGAEAACRRPATRPPPARTTRAPRTRPCRRSRRASRSRDVGLPRASAGIPERGTASRSATRSLEPELGDERLEARAHVPRRSASPARRRPSAPPPAARRSARIGDVVALHVGVAPEREQPAGRRPRRGRHRRTTTCRCRARSPRTFGERERDAAGVDRESTASTTRSARRRCAPARCCVNQSSDRDASGRRSGAASSAYTGDMCASSPVGRPRTSSRASAASKRRPRSACVGAAKLRKRTFAGSASTVRPRRARPPRPRARREPRPCRLPRRASGGRGRPAG